MAASLGSPDLGSEMGQCTIVDSRPLLPDHCTPSGLFDILHLGVWILDVGYLYFGFWDLGMMWNLEFLVLGVFGFWSFDFGVWILDFVVWVWEFWFCFCDPPNY